MNKAQRSKFQFLESPSGRELLAYMFSRVSHTSRNHRASRLAAAAAMRVSEPAAHRHVLRSRVLLSANGGSDHLLHSRGIRSRITLGSGGFSNFHRARPSLGLSIRIRSRGNRDSDIGARFREAAMREVTSAYAGRPLSRVFSARLRSDADRSGTMANADSRRQREA
jgi:hypothetical protein